MAHPTIGGAEEGFVMSNYQELSDGLDVVLAKMKESEEFKRRLRLLVERAVQDEAYRDNDLQELLFLEELDLEGNG